MAGLATAVSHQAVQAEPPPPVDLEWHVEGAACPSRDTVLERVRQLLATEVAGTPRIRGRAELTRNDGRLVLVVRVTDGEVEDTRTAESRSCAALGEAAAIILATAIDAARERHAGQSGPASEATEIVSPPRSEAHPSETPPSGPPKRRRVTRPRSLPAPVAKPAVGVGAAALFDFGTLPRPTAGLELAVFLRRDRWQLAIAGSLWQPREQSFAARTPGGARFDVLTFGGFGCWTPAGKRFRLGGCAELDVSRLEITGFGIRRPSVARGVWPTVRAGIIGEARLSRSASVFIRTDAAFALAVPRIVLTTTASDVDLHEVGSPALHLTIGGRTDIF